MWGFVKRKSNNIENRIVKKRITKISRKANSDIKCIAKTTIGSENVYKVRICTWRKNKTKKTTTLE